MVLHLLVLFMLTVVTADGSEACDDARNATMHLQSYIRGLAVVKDKVAPLVTDADGNVTIPVKAILSVTHLLRVNDAEQTMTTASYLGLVWHDSQLTWDPQLYGGVDIIELPSSLLWTPDVAVVNSVDIRKPMELVDTLAVYSNGLVKVAVFQSLETACSMDHELFPFDEQSCQMVFSAYSNYIVWQIISASSEDNEVRKAGVNDWDVIQITSQVTYLSDFEHSVPVVQLVMRRRTIFYSVSLILPMVLTSYMNTLVFLIPVQSGEKVSFLVTIFVSTSVFTSFFSNAMPRGLDKMPGSMKLLVYVIAESFFALLATIVVLRRFHEEELVATDHRDGSDDSPAGGNTTAEHLDLKGSKAEKHQPPSSNTLRETPKIHDGFFRPRLGRAQVGPEQHGGQVWMRLDQSVKKRGWRAHFTARNLDNVFFLLTLVGNTVGVCVILFTIL